MRDPRERLKDILQAIENINRYSRHGRKEFDDNELVQNWFIRHLQIIGESSRALPEDIRALAPDVPWNQVIGMRHILVHDYFEIDNDIVWGVIENDLPKLKARIEGLLRDMTL
jgi:uncharacterized protein with HEPN domain